MDAAALDEMHALLREYARTRDHELRNRLVLMNERLVHYLVNRFTPGRGNTNDDLVQVGYMGLIDAIERFDPEMGGRFVTFATPTILGVIKRYLRDQGWLVRAPRHLRDLAMRLPRLRAELEYRLGRPPTVAEMADAAGVEEERLLEATDLGHLAEPSSLDAPAAENGDAVLRELLDRVGQLDPNLAAIEERELMRQALARLGERERAIIRCRFFEHASQEEVARRLGISQMHVSRLERQALRQLRTVLS